VVCWSCPWTPRLVARLRVRRTSSSLQGSSRRRTNSSSYPLTDKEIRVSQLVGEISSAPVVETLTDLTIPAPEALTVDWSVDPPVLTGTAVPGATVHVTDEAGNPLPGSPVTADENGTWELVLPAGVDPASEVQVVQTVIGVDSAPTSLILEDAPTVSPLMAGGVIAIGLGVLTITGYARRRRTAVLPVGTARS
jgi:hypothetical protein